MTEIFCNLIIITSLSYPIGKDKCNMQIVNTANSKNLISNTKMLVPTLKKNTLRFYLGLGLNIVY